MKNLVEMFGIGRFSKATGTIASAVSLPILYFTKDLLGWYYYTFAFLIFLPYAIKLCGEEFTKSGDSKNIVLDEFVGVAAMFVFMGKLTMLKVVVGFLFFRILDIFKPWPISIWQGDKNQVSVVADDLLAGMISGLILSFNLF